MEDTRGKERAKKLFYFHQEDPKKQREEYLVALRKKKRSELFMSKRKFADFESNKENEFIVPDFGKKCVIEHSEVLAHKLLESTDQFTIANVVEAISELLKSTWNEKFVNVLMSKAGLKRYNQILNSDNSNAMISVLKILTNVAYYIEGIEAEVLSTMVEVGIFESIYQCLNFPQNITQINTEKCKSAILGLANFGWLSAEAANYLLENHILVAMRDWGETHQIQKDEAFADYVILLIDSMIGMGGVPPYEDVLYYLPLLNKKILSLVNGDYLQHTVNLI